MSAPTNSDFVKGFDFTGVVAATPAEVNNLVDNAVPYQEVDALEGKGLTVVTKDTAIDTPSVPDAVSVVKWKRYLWTRLPYAGADWTTPKVYVWADLATSVATYLKWVEVGDTSTLQSDLTTLETQVTNLDTNVTDLTAQVNATSTIANNAATTANDAAADIVVLEASVATAAANSQTAINTANAASTAATAAQATASADKDIIDGVVATNGTAGQRLEVNAAASPKVLAYYSAANKYAFLTEQYADTVAPPAMSAGTNTRAINTEQSDTGNLITLPGAGVMTFNIAGTYRIRASACVGVVVGFTNVFYNNTTAAIVLTGMANTCASGSTDATVGTVEGIITVTAGHQFTLRSYCSDAGTGGYAASVGVAEIYSTVEIEKLD